MFSVILERVVFTNKSVLAGSLKDGPERKVVQLGRKIEKFIIAV